MLVNASNNLNVYNNNKITATKVELLEIFQGNLYYLYYMPIK